MGGPGHRRAITPAFLDYRPSLRRFILRMAFSKDEVDDLLQDVFLNAYRAKGDEVLEEPRAYLYQVARTLFYRANRRRAENFKRMVEGLDLDVLITDEANGERIVDGRDRLARLFRFVETLPPRCKEVFVLRHVYGHSHHEIATELGIARSTVEKHLAKAMLLCEAEQTRLDDATLPDPKQAPITLDRQR